MKVKTIELSSSIDKEKGALSFFEAMRDIPFEIKRIYFIYNVPHGEVRGHHAHKNLKQLLFCPIGHIEITLDNGMEVKKIILDKPSKGLIIEEGIWRTMEFKSDSSILCVAASEYYDENDYIRNYNDFIDLIKVGYWQ